MIDQNPTADSAAPRRELGLFDSVCIIVGIVIGAGIYKAPLVAGNVSGDWSLILVWVLGGVLALAGSLCYAELATAYPKEGGDYVFLNEAFGRRWGFLFAWAQLWVIRPGSIGAMAFIFADYANQIFPLGDSPAVLVFYAAAAVLLLTGVNLLGIRIGKWTQNLFSVAKYLGLAMVCWAGLFGCDAPAAPLVATPAAMDLSAFGQAMIFVLFAYGGWNEMAYVGAEVRNPRKNIVRALLLGTIAVVLIYVLANFAFLRALGLEGMRGSKEIAGDTLQSAIGQRGRLAIQWLIIVTALGAIQGMIFTGSRIYYAMGNDYRLYARLGRWNGRHGAPIYAMLLQSAIALALVIGFGWTKKNGFESLVIFTTPVFWIFFFLAALAVIVLRRRRPEIERPFRVPFYPVLPLVFCLSCLFMVYASISWAVANSSPEAFWSIGLMAAGILASFWSK
jgi:basic amino acid/polyamine antiporter, APA family